MTQHQNVLMSVKGLNVKGANGAKLMVTQAEVAPASLQFFSGHTPNALLTDWGCTVQAQTADAQATA